MAAYDFGVWSVADEERASPLQRSLAARWQAGLGTAQILWIGLKKLHILGRSKMCKPTNSPRLVHILWEVHDPSKVSLTHYSFLK